MSLRIALGEYDIGWHDPSGSIARATKLIERAAAAGARLVALPEMCTTGFTMEAGRYSEPVDGPSANQIAAAAKRAGVYVIAGIATRAGDGARVSSPPPHQTTLRSNAGEDTRAPSGEDTRTPHSEKFYNSAVLLGPDGTRLAEYRKQRLFAYATEHDTYTPGTEPVVAEIEGVRVALLICFDLRFPELFKAVAPTSDCIVVIASWPAARQTHWDTLLRARAIESQAYVVGVNRIGRGGDFDYAGGSAAYDPWGEPLAVAGDPPIVSVDPARVAGARRDFPFVRDARQRDT